MRGLGRLCSLGMICRRVTSPRKIPCFSWRSLRNTSRRKFIKLGSEKVNTNKREWASSWRRNFSQFKKAKVKKNKSDNFVKITHIFKIIAHPASFSYLHRYLHSGWLPDGSYWTAPPWNEWNLSSDTQIDSASKLPSSLEISNSKGSVVRGLEAYQRLLTVAFGIFRRFFHFDSRQRGEFEGAK